MKKNLLISLLTVIMAVPAIADDNGMISPYSRYGFGRQTHRMTGFNSGMAGVGIGSQNGAEVNPLNPASYAQIDSLSFIFDIGASVQRSNFRDGKHTTAATTATFDYVTMGFRATKQLGVSLGIMPLTHVGYNNTATKTIADDYNHGTEIQATRSYTGEGGLHEVYLGAAWSPIKYASLGINAGYIWGDLNHLSTVNYNDASVSPSLRAYLAHIHTYSLRAGIQFYIPMGKNDRLVLGGNYSLGHKLDDNAYMVVSSDTTSARNAFEIPHTIGAGFSWEHAGKLRIAGDYELQKWGSCRYPWLTRNVNGTETYSAGNGYLRDSHRIAVGMEYRPLKKGSNWREYVTYKAGFSMCTPYTNVSTSSSSNLVKGPTSYLVTVGVNLPIMNIFNARSSVNIALQYEHIKPEFEGQLKENYFRLCLGINFNEDWFMKWKVK